MVRRKKVRARGKIQFSKYFQNFEKGDPVSIVKEKSLDNPIPRRMQGRTGKVDSKRGKAYIVSINDQNKEKKFIINPVNLRRVK